MTLEAQAALVAEAKARADAEIQSQMIPAQAPTRLAGPCAARAACLGHDRQGRAYWRIASFELYTEKIGGQGDADMVGAVWSAFSIKQRPWCFPGANHHQLGPHPSTHPYQCRCRGTSGAAAGRGGQPLF